MTVPVPGREGCRSLSGEQPGASVVPSIPQGLVFVTPCVTELHHRGVTSPNVEHGAWEGLRSLRGGSRSMFAVPLLVPPVP